MILCNDEDESKINLKKIVNKIFQKEAESKKITNLDKFFEIYNLASTIKPIYDY